jgi:hypothetical protein
MSKEWTVWVGGSEVTDFYVTETEARTIAEMYRRMGYDDVSLEHVPRDVVARVRGHQTR